MSRPLRHARYPAHLCHRLLLIAAGLAVISTGCTRREPDDGKLHLTYWEKWERFEADAMKAVVAQFNASQDRIVVHYVHSSGAADRKTLIATAGGDPPDIAGLWDGNVVPFADRGALHPLDAYMRRDGLTRDHWIDVYADICTYQGTMWAVPTTPTTVGLYWNKALFRESAGELRAAGLDPDRAPRTLDELDAYARVLTRFDDEGRITQMGFLPHDPIHGWFAWAYPYWFGGHLFDGDKVTANHPRNVAAFEWVQQYSREYGPDRLNAFASGFGNFASPQNPFFSGKVAMVIQGVWLYNYISQYAPGMQWGAAPMPKVPGGPDEFTIAGCDVLVIPAGLPEYRCDAAWEFLKFASSQPAMELLCKGQKKNSPVRAVSDAFLRDHPHPYIELFTEMAHYRNVVRPPGYAIWRQYQQNEINAVLERMRLLQVNPATGKPYTAKEALDIAQQHMTRVNERHLASLARRRAHAAEAVP